MQEPPQKKQCTLLQSASPSTVETTIPINALTPYTSNWSIKGHVHDKSNLRHFTNQKGPGKVFGFDFIDKDGGEIHITCFNDSADVFYDQVLPGHVYLISKGTIKPTNKMYSHLTNEWEIFLQPTSIVQHFPLETIVLPQMHFNFKTIKDIKSSPVNSIVDIIGVVTNTSPVAPIHRKDGSETIKKSIHIKDNSGFSMDVTLWGEHCHVTGQELSTLRSENAHPVLAIKGGRVAEFNGKTVGTTSKSIVIINPDIPEKHKLTQWFEKDGFHTSSPSLTTRYPTSPNQIKKNEPFLKLKTFILLKELNGFL